MSVQGPEIVQLLERLRKGWQTEAQDVGLIGQMLSIQVHVHYYPGVAGSVCEILGAKENARLHLHVLMRLRADEEGVNQGHFDFLAQQEQSAETLDLERALSQSLKEDRPRL